MRAASLLAALIAAAPACATAQPPSAKPPTAYAWPPETARFIEAPGVQGAQVHCLVCHSADYVNTQPRGMPEAFWAAEVAKMRTAYGAKIADDDVKGLVTYLTTAYGAATPAGR